MPIYSHRAALCALAAALFLPACGSKTDKPAGEAELVRAPVERGEIARIINAAGRVKPATTVQVGSEVSGKIVEIKADFNTLVKAGDVLAVIDPETFSKRVEQQRAGLENARANIRVQEAAVVRARVNREQAVTELARVQNLFVQKAASASRLETARRNAGVAEADLILSEAQLDAAKASLRQSEASLDTARVDLGRTVIRAPIDGIVVDRKVDAGQTVAASFSAPELFVIAADLAQVQVEAAIVESDVSGLDAGDAVTFVVDAYPAQTFEGTVKELRLNPTEAQNIVTYTAVVTAANPERLLLPGMSASLQITTEARKNILRMPAGAERFRPSEAEIRQWAGAAGAGAAGPSEELPGWEQILGALKAAGLADARIASVRTELLAETEDLREAIANPEQTFQRTPNLKRLNERIRLYIERSLEPAQLKLYSQARSGMSQVREAQIWVVGNDGKLARRLVGLGVSDGTYTEVMRGLKEGEPVAISIRTPAPAGEKGNPRGGPPGAPRRL